MSNRQLYTLHAHTRTRRPAFVWLQITYSVQNPRYSFLKNGLIASVLTLVGLEKYYAFQICSQEKHNFQVKSQGKY